MTSPIVSIKDIRKSFGAAEVLKGVSLDVAKGECVCIIGPSGSGKSTILRCINALTPVNSGSIEVDGIEVVDPKLDKLALRRKVGIVFQSYNLFPHKTALENIMMAPLTVLRQDKAEVEARARALLQKVRLAEKASSYPGELSGGQQQRVAIARSLAMQPALILADEPTGNLDSKSADTVFSMMRKVNVDQGTTFLIVTHNMELARRCDRIVEVVDGRMVGGRQWQKQ